MDKREIYRVTQFSMENNLEATQDKVISLIAEVNGRNKMVARMDDPIMNEIVFYEIDKITKDSELIK